MTSPRAPRSRQVTAALMRKPVATRTAMARSPARTTSAAACICVGDAGCDGRPKSAGDGARVLRNTNIDQELETSARFAALQAETRASVIRIPAHRRHAQLSSGAGGHRNRQFQVFDLGQFVVPEIRASAVRPPPLAGLRWPLPERKPALALRRGGMESPR